MSIRVTDFLITFNEAPLKWSFNFSFHVPYSAVLQMHSPNFCLWLSVFNAYWFLMNFCIQGFPQGPLVHKENFQVKYMYFYVQNGLHRYKKNKKKMNMLRLCVLPLWLQTKTTVGILRCLFYSCNIHLLQRLSGLSSSVACTLLFVVHYGTGTISAVHAKW